MKKTASIARAHRLGISLFAFDSEEELRKIARAAPGSRVYCRLMVANDGADWPLSRKFGTSSEEAIRLLPLAATLGLVPYGVSFHVGSQQTEPRAYADAIAEAAVVFESLAARGLTLAFLNLGGGLPVRYREEVPASTASATRSCRRSPATSAMPCRTSPSSRAGPSSAMRAWYRARWCW